MDKKTLIARGILGVTLAVTCLGMGQAEAGRRYRDGYRHGYYRYDRAYPYRYGDGYRYRVGGWRGGWRRDRDLDNDGIRNSRDRDRDGDGIPNRRDRHPR